MVHKCLFGKCRFYFRLFNLCNIKHTDNQNIYFLFESYTLRVECRLYIIIWIYVIEYGKVPFINNPKASVQSKCILCSYYEHTLVNICFYCLEGINILKKRSLLRVVWGLWIQRHVILSHDEQMSLEKMNTEIVHGYMSLAVCMCYKAVCSSSCLSSSSSHVFCVPILEASWSLPTPSWTGKSGWCLWRCFTTWNFCLAR